MEEHLQKTLEQAKAQLREQEEAVIVTKKFINQVCSFAGIPALYKDADLKVTSKAGLGTIRPDTFYGKSVTTAAREYLEMRLASEQGVASLSEIIEALTSGGFDFSSISEDEDDAKRGVAITLAKNSSIFHKIPGGQYGLLSWYPEIKDKKAKKKEENGDSKPAPSGLASKPSATPEADPITQSTAEDLLAAKPASK